MESTTTQGRYAPLAPVFITIPTLLLESADLPKSHIFLFYTHHTLPSPPVTLRALYSNRVCCFRAVHCLASSSAMGSPLRNRAGVPGELVNTNHGLGLPAAVMNDLFSHEYMGVPSTWICRMKKSSDPFCRYVSIPIIKSYLVY